MKDCVWLHDLSELFLKKQIALDLPLWPSEFLLCFTTTSMYPILKEVQYTVGRR